MEPADTSVPFSIEGVFRGLAEARGLARVGSDGVVLEFEVKDRFVGMIRSGVNRAVIPLLVIRSVEFKKSWFRAAVVVRTDSMAAVEGIPGSESGTVTLVVERRNRSLAEAFVSSILLAQSERQLRAAQSLLDRTTREGGGGDAVGTGSGGEGS